MEKIILFIIKKQRIIFKNDENKKLKSSINLVYFHFILRKMNNHK